MNSSPSRAALAIVLFAATATAAHADKLRSPWDSVKVVPTDAPYSCPAPPPFARTLDLAAYYIDKNASIADAQKFAAFQKGSEAPTHLGQFASLAADAYLSKGSRAAALCLYSLLDAAAKADAWTDKMPDFNGVYLQNWLLSGAAISYLKLRQSGLATPIQDAEIRRWFRLLSIRVREYFDAELVRIGLERENNHLYWAGLAVAAEGIIDDNPRAMQWGMDSYAMGVDSIQPDGSLKTEMARAGKALHYHLYAVGPLIMLAELGVANGVDPYAYDKGAIHRLVAFCVAGLLDPTILEKRTGVPQEVPHPLAGLDIGWAIPYVRRFPNPQLSALIAQAEWTRFWQWGGAPPD